MHFPRMVILILGSHRTVKQYVDWITDFANYIRREGLNIHYGQSVKLFLVFRHETRKVAKRSNKRQKVSIGQDIKQKAIKHVKITL